MLGQRGMGGDEAFGKLGRRYLIGLGEHDLVGHRRLVECGEHVVVDGFEAVAGIDQEIDARERGAALEKGLRERRPRLDLALRRLQSLPPKRATGGRPRM